MFLARRVSFVVSYGRVLFCFPRLTQFCNRCYTAAMDRIGQWLWYVNLAASAMLLVRFWLTRIYLSQRLLYAFFLVKVALGIALLRIPYRSDLYTYVYVAAEVAAQLLAFFALLELYRNALARHKGLASFGRAAVWVVTGIVTLLASVSATLDQDIPRGQSAILHRYFTVERTVDIAIVLFLLVIAVFVTWFPVKMSRNVILSIAGFSVFYALKVGALLALNVMPYSRLAAINDLAMALTGGLMIAWSCLVRAEVVSDEVVAGHAWDPEAMEVLSHQLDSINTALTRFGRN